MGPIPYKPGDLVICRHPDRTWLRRDQTYCVTEILRDRFGGDLVGLARVPGLLFADWRFDPYRR